METLSWMDIKKGKNTNKINETKKKKVKKEKKRIK